MYKEYEDAVETLAILNCMLIECVSDNETWQHVYHAYEYIADQNNVTDEDSRIISIASGEGWRVGRAQGRAI
jgi:hypothetical protein